MLINPKSKIKTLIGTYLNILRLSRHFSVIILKLKFWDAEFCFQENIYFLERKLSPEITRRMCMITCDVGDFSKADHTNN